MSDFEVLNGYRSMWLFCFFDLPVVKKADQKKAAKFRKQIMEDGFTMHQFSVYLRHCGSKESAIIHQIRVMGFVPDKGRVSLLSVTDKQYKDIKNIWGRSMEPVKKIPQQLEFF